MAPGLLLWLSSCASDSPKSVSFEDCLYGAPEPIFNESVPGVSHHNFELIPGKGIESFILNGSTTISIEQTGCDQLVQQFTFSWEGVPSGSDSRYWAKKAIQLFGELGQLGATYLSFAAISDVLSQQQEKLQPGDKSIPLQPGLYFKIEQKTKGQKAILIATLYESTPASG